jgi:redox-sensitive bicupin YhaK (pirin superfamily)
MMQIRKSSERGYADHGWLTSFHSFSFADYHDPAHVAFGPLRVINEDRVAAGKGFERHGHRDMEIVSYVLDGALEHRDSLGTGAVIRPGDVQRMSAGTGVMHSEFNASATEPVHFLQIWIEPDARGIAPGYEQKHFVPEDKDGRLCLIASRDGRDGSVTIHQDAAIYAGLFEDTQRAEHRLERSRRAYVHVVRGAIDVNGERLHTGDAAKLTDAPLVALANGVAAEVLLFDLP